MVRIIGNGLPDGRDYDIYDFPFVEADGSNLILEMGIDITERKRAEKQIRDVSLYSRSLIEASLDPLVTISVKVRSPMLMKLRNLPLAAPEKN